MKKLIMSLILVSMLSIPTMVVADPIPTAQFYPESCWLAISPNGHALDLWSICVNDSMTIGLVLTSEEQGCDLLVDIEEANGMDMSEYVTCDIATPESSLSFGKLKSYYR